MKSRSLWVTVFLLLVGYSGFYLCRSCFSVAKPLLLATFPEIDKAKLGFFASVGTLLYAVGKFVHGPLADRFGGKVMFLYGMLGAVVFCTVFGLGGPPFFLIAWSGNRFVQSSGWGGMLRIVSQWTTRSIYGSIMAFVSLSYLFGDFVSRLLLGYWVRIGYGWKELFLFSALGLLILFVPIAFFLREKPDTSVAEEAQTRETGSEIGSIFARPEFWIVCGLSFCFTLLRETFNEWTPTFLNEYARLSKADAGQASSIFPLLGGLSVIAVGLLSDRFADRYSPLLRLKVIPWGLACGGLFLAILGLVPSLNQMMIVLMVGAVAFCLIGPYSLLAGATSLDFGGKEKAATAAGWIDGIGYFGGILSGLGIGSLAQKFGWSAAMNSLAAFCFLVAIGLNQTLKFQRKKFSDVA